MQNLRSAFAARRTSSEPHALVIHAEGDWYKSIQDGKFDFFTKLVRHATRQGVPSRIVAAGGNTSKLLLEQDHINIVVGDMPRRVKIRVVQRALFNKKKLSYSFLSC